MILSSRVRFFVFITILFFNQQGFALNPPVTQSLIKNGDFSEVDKNGNPIGWRCICQYQQETCDLKNDPTSSGKILTLQPGCQLRSTRFPISNQSQGIILGVVTKLIPDNFQDISLIAYSNNQWMGHVPFETSHPSLNMKLPDGFMLRAKSLSSDNVNTISVVINNNHDKNIQIKKIDALQSGENPATKSATLLEATHETILKILPNSDVKDIWMPLPIDYASQVPLWIHVQATPSAVVHTIRYSEDDIGNWGTIIELNNNIAPGTEIHLRWDGIVLTKMINEDERSEVYRAESDPTVWLQSTKTAESQYQPISDLAINLTKNDSDFLKKIADLSFWEVKNLRFPTDHDNNDAITTFNDRRANCVGFANLASAMGRAIGVSTRSIANYMVDDTSQSTHFINEFYLGPNSGWRRIEPQSGVSIPVPEDLYFIIHKDTPDNESEIAFNQGNWGMSGTPYNSMVNNLNDSSANVTFLLALNIFPDCPADALCDNRAEHWLDLRGSHEEMKNLFEIARKNWQYDLQDYLKQGEINPKRQMIRDNVPAMQSTEDLAKLLSELDRYH